MCTGLEIAGIIAATAAVGGTAYSAYAGQQSASAQRDAQSQARAQAEKTAKAQEEATNRANQKSPDTSAIMAAAQQAAKGGPSSTMLTGPAGAAAVPNQLGRSSLLGG